MKRDVTPSNSRYIPFTQQPACCVPTCIQMVMYRHNIPLIPTEKLGYYLGLTVHPDRTGLFYCARTSVTKPHGGYGTQIYRSEYEPNRVFKKLHIPLKFSLKQITYFKSEKQVVNYLQKSESNDKDVLLCFHHGTLTDSPSKDWGHLCLFDRFFDERIRIIDPSYDEPKWRLVTVGKMLEAMKKHGNKNVAGFWELSVTR